MLFGIIICHVSEMNNHKYKHFWTRTFQSAWSMMYSNWSVVLVYQRPSSCFIRGVHSQMYAPCSHLQHPPPLVLLHLSKAEIMWHGFIILFRSQASFAQQRPQSSIWHWFLLIYVEQAVLGVHVHWAWCPSSLLCLQWQWYGLWWNMEANQDN